MSLTSAGEPQPKKLGLIINPLAGIGGRVGLKGSDGDSIQARAFELGAQPEAPNRAKLALQRIAAFKSDFQLFTCSGEMGQHVASQCGLEPQVILQVTPGHTTAIDTQNAAREMQRLGAGFLLFAGGDGTARDIFTATGDSLPVVGIPAGVKIQSAVFARNPSSAGELALQVLRAKNMEYQHAEVMDIDEERFRQGMLSARLYGYLRVPPLKTYLQGVKSSQYMGEGTALNEIASHVVSQMQDDYLYIIGPGTTTRLIADIIGAPKTLLGVDVFLNKNLLLQDAREDQLLALLEKHKAKIIITPIGGQGFLFGRGNQQISPRVIQQVGVENISVISTSQKIDALEGAPLLVDTGDQRIDRQLTGYIKVITACRESVIYPVST